MRTFSESELAAFAAELVDEIRRTPSRPRPRVALSGPLGAGKSTLARAILEALGIRRDAEGSPTFAVAHEYLTRAGERVVHADGYRLGSDAELEATGLVETLWDPAAIVLFEWLELFGETAESLRGSDLPTIWVRLDFVAGNAACRTLAIERTGGRG